MASATHALSTPSLPSRSATVHAIRNTLSTPLAVSRPVVRASSIIRVASLAGNICRKTFPGTSALHRQGAPRHRAAARSRACATRSCTTALDSPAGKADASSRCADVSGRIRTVTSTLSKIGPESRPEYRRTCCGVHVHRPDGSSASPHGHGLSAITS